MSDLRCPEDGEPLVGIALERAHGTVHQCLRCHGVWVERELIERLEKAMASDPPSAVGLPAEARGLPPPNQSLARDFHLPCAVCDALMDVKAGGGVVLDVCREHGIWFEAGELEPFVTWVRAGRPQSGTHHRTVPLASSLGLAAPMVSAQGSGGEAAWGAFELVGGVLEALVTVVEILAD